MKFVTLPKRCLERKRIIETIRRKGEFVFNTNKMLNDDTLHVARRPNVRFNKKATEYGICVKCYGYFSKNTLRNHIRKCINIKQSRNRTITVLGRTILGRIHEVASQTLKKVVFPILKEDEILYNLLKKKFSYDTWLSLGECTLTFLQIYNRKRAGETQRILLEDFYTYEGLNEQTDPDLFKSLSNSAKEIIFKYVRFQIRRKLGRTVSVLLHFDLLNCINLFIQCRAQAKVHPNNPYLFGIVSFHKQRHKHLRACDLMRKFANECNADNPERLRGTLLRKQIATNCDKLKLTEQEVSELADFMGHTKDIHKQYYRLPRKETDILVISKYLDAAIGTSDDSENNSDKVMIKMFLMIQIIVTMIIIIVVLT
ncbi:hypothetical protein ALC57_12099 [Trachymyrmex cornetzi]|uniref:Uncharacterized protein n=1 Tax=Trachymyrmex cornetzi TaxID=471704 RepID=A0A151J1U8_9HYME|nr:hypothetical protein ALC57_12099 [Trachymyrmex cornetzi]